MSTPLQIDVVSDVVCPWCYIGKRRLEQALARVPGTAVEVRWRPFELNPQLPAQGVDRAEYMRLKFGGRLQQIHDRVAGVGREVGIEFAFDRIARQPNTMPAHQLIRVAQTSGVQDAMVETLFRAYFIAGTDLTSRANLLELANRAGLATHDAELALDDGQVRQTVIDEESSARSLGIEGVPFFIFAGRIGVSGAQPAEVLLQAIEQARG